MLSFTLTYDGLTNDTSDVTGDVAAVALTGPMWFEPTGLRIPALDNLPRPAGLSVRAFPAFLDTDGRLKPEAGGEIGVRLWANNPDWGIPRWQYRVRADLTDQLGNPVPWDTFYFDAPTEDLTVDLSREMPKPSQKFGRGRPGFGVGGTTIDGSGDLVVIREDGLELGSMVVPELSDTLGQANAETISYVMTFGR